MCDSQALVRDLYSAFDAGDVPAFLEHLAPDVVWNEAEGNPLADGNPYTGKDAIVSGVFERLLAEWLGFKVEVQEIVGGPEVVTMIGRYTATHTTSGKPLDVQCVHTWWIDVGARKVVRFQQMVDTHGLLDAAT